jgi:hypothetical protein
MSDQWNQQYQPQRRAPRYGASGRQDPQQPAYPRDVPPQGYQPLQQPPPGPPQSHYYPAAQPAVARPKRKRRIFLWVFLAVQVLFILWLVVGLATTHTGPTQAQLAQVCYHHAWYPLFSSQADCVQHYGGALQDAGNAGKAIGAGLIVVAWVVVDFFMGVGYGVYKLATR